jgi:hypothetical protein
VVEQNRTSSHGKRSVATAALLIGAVALLAFVPACSSSSTPATSATSTSTSATTSTTSSVTLPEQDPAELAACASDARSLETALADYMAEKGAYPSPPAPWSAATYAANYQPLTAAAGGGPFLPSPPTTRFYVIEYDSSGHVWIAPPGAYSAAYDPAQSASATANVCLAAVG